MAGFWKLLLIIAGIVILIETRGGPEKTTAYITLVLATTPILIVVLQAIAYEKRIFQTAAQRTGLTTQ